MTILITGAAGMIGSGIIRHLNDQGKDNLLLVDDLGNDDKWKNLVGKRFIGIIPINQLMNYLNSHKGEIDAIFHMGACSDTTETNADFLLENNTRYTIRLAEWALHENVRFIYASSAATYGNGEEGFDDDESKIQTLKPLNMYAFSKQLVDLWMLRQGVLNQVVALKYFNVFGPNEYHKKHMASMVLKMTHKAQNEGVIHLYKSNHEKYLHGGQMRDFIYLKDAVKMTCALIDPAFRTVGGIFNIGQGKPTTWNILAEALFKALQKRANIEYIDMPQQLARQYQNYTCAAMSKLHTVLSPPYLSTTPIDEAVGEYVQQYLIKGARW